MLITIVIWVEMTLVLKNIILSFWTYRAARVFLGGIFLWSGTGKLLDPDAFARIISVYELVPDALLLPVAFGLPLLEVVAGLGLIFDLRYALSLVTGMLMLFVVVLQFGILKGLEIDCGCFSANEVAEQNGLRTAFRRDLLFIAVALYLFLWRRLAPGSQNAWRMAPSRTCNARCRDIDGIVGQ